MLETNPTAPFHKPARHTPSKALAEPDAILEASMKTLQEHGSCYSDQLKLMDAGLSRESQSCQRVGLGGAQIGSQQAQQILWVVIGFA